MPATFRKSFNNPSAHRNALNNPEELFDLTMNNLMDGFYDYALDSSNEGKFKAICLSGLNTGDNTGGSSGEQFQPAVVSGRVTTIIVRPLQSFAETLPDPTTSKDKTQLIKIISLHKVFTARYDKEEEMDRIPQFGEIVDCYYEDGSVSRSNFQNLKFELSSVGGQILSAYHRLQTMDFSSSAQSAFDRNRAGILGSEQSSSDPSRADNIIKEYANSLPSAGLTDGGVGIDANILKTVTEGQLTFWKGKKDKRPNADTPEGNVLTAYWALQGFGYKDWAWSAVFVSYVLQSANTGFPGDISHYKYMLRVINEPGTGWKAFSLTKESGAKISVGDVLINPRTEILDRTAEEYYYSHGDVVYKIEGGYAFLAGGNLSKTAKTAVKIKVDSQNMATKFDYSTQRQKKHYMVILKKVS